ncbi:MAG: sugar phosphate isomerase/epimerase [Chloroflexia bacterium]|nr:sugar phosphate isomerase/epimerase [Chloroflexia bacterium]
MPRLGVITDEISEDFDHALAVCQELGIRDIELRSIWGKSIVDHDDATVSRIEQAVHAGGFRVNCIASPFLKCHLNDESAAAGNTHSASEKSKEEHWAILDRSLELANQFDSPIVRVFSFWRVADPVSVRDEILDILSVATEHVSAAGKLLGLENEYACNVATGEESRWILDHISNHALGLIWDPGNEAALGSNPFPGGYEHVKDRIHHVHLKDAVAIELNTGFTRMGDGAIDYLGQFRALVRDRYEGVLSLETHYKVDGDPEPATRACAASTRDLARKAGLVFDDRRQPA